MSSPTWTCPSARCPPGPRRPPATTADRGAATRSRGLKLRLDSVAVGALAGPLLAEQGEIDAITALLNDPGPGAVTTGQLPDVGDIPAGLGTRTSSDGSLTVNLATGVVTVDLEEIINLDDLSPNTPLLPYVLNALTTQLAPTVDAAADELRRDVVAALHAVTTTSAVPVPAGVLDEVIDAVIAGLSRRSPAT